VDSLICRTGEEPRVIPRPMRWSDGAGMATQPSVDCNRAMMSEMILLWPRALAGLHQWVCWRLIQIWAYGESSILWHGKQWVLSDHALSKNWPRSNSMEALSEASAPKAGALPTFGEDTREWSVSILESDWNLVASHHRTITMLRW